MDSTLHMVIGVFLEGVSKMLADTVEVNDPQNLERHKSGLGLWGLLEHNFERASAFTAVSILESIRNSSRPQTCCRIKGTRVREHEDARRQCPPRGV